MSPRIANWISYPLAQGIRVRMIRLCQTSIINCWGIPLDAIVFAAGEIANAVKFVREKNDEITDRVNRG